MSDKPADLITLADAIEKIGQARHGPAWVSLNENLETFRVRLETGNTPVTVAATIANFEKNNALRRPIELEILGKLRMAELPTYWRPNGGDLLPIAPNQWNSFELEANRYWPDAKISGKAETVYLRSAALKIFNMPTASTGSRRGAKIKYDWPDAIEHGIALLNQHGEFREWDSEWKAQADLERAMLAYMEKTLGAGNGPSEAAIRPKARTCIQKWRMSKAKGR